MISVIVPVYNVETYIERCINSLVEQSYRNIEIILVDDGATDNSGKICDEWALRDTRIRVIHQSNLGLSGARNTGLENASGEYLLLVDGDDYVEKDYVSRLLGHATENNTDITFCNYRFVDVRGNEISNDNHSSFCSKRIYDGIETCELFEDKAFRTYFDICWNKLYKRELFEGVRFPVGVSVIEDISVMPLLYNSATRVSFVDDVLYNYVFRENSLSHSKMTAEEDAKLRAPMMETRLQWYKNWGNKELCLTHIIHMYSLYENVKSEYSNRRKELQKEYRKIYIFGKAEGQSKKIGFVKSISKKRKIKFFVAFCGLNFYSILTKVK